MKKIFVLAILILTVLLSACLNTGRYEGQGETQKAEAEYTERNQNRLLKDVPPPELDHSLERVNLDARVRRFNDPNKVSYIYLLSDTGQIYTFLPIKGKVSSVNSKLTTGEQIVPYCIAGDCTGYVVESPQEDGSYGTNGDAIFFFTTEDVYVEWNGKYLLLDQPLQLTSQPLLIYDADK